MNLDNLDPDLVKKAKKIAAGPLGEKMAKFPLLFAAATFFGESPTCSYPQRLNSGTTSLIDFGNGPIAITCFHVLDEYRKRLKKDPQTIFQIGLLQINPLKNIIDENKDLDLVTINLANENVKEIANNEEIGSRFFNPPFWPAKDVKEGDFVAFGGFPGK